MNGEARREDDECLQTLLRFDLMIYMEIMHCDVEVELQLLREEAEDVADQTLEPPVQRREPWRAARRVRERAGAGHLHQPDREYL